MNLRQVIVIVRLCKSQSITKKVLRLVELDTRKMSICIRAKAKLPSCGVQSLCKAEKLSVLLPLLQSTNNKDKE